MADRVFVTGANGMLGDALCQLLKEEGYQVFFTDLLSNSTIAELDIRDASAVHDMVKGEKPDILFHLAAETDVDKCELQPEHAYKVNAEGTKNIAEVCALLNIPLVYISTGAVFDGEKQGGYTEADRPNPLNVYGKSKLKGEEIITALLEKYYIVRAGWMVGGLHRDKKFVWKIIQLLETQKEIPVVMDKKGSPTFTKDLARQLIAVVSKGVYGIYHGANHGICTRYELAREIAEYMEAKDVVLTPVTSDAFPLPAPRGKSEGLLSMRLKKLGIDIMRPWQDALKEYIKEYKALNP